MKDLNNLNNKITEIENNIEKQNVNSLHKFIYKSEKWIINNQDDLNSDKDQKLLKKINNKLKALDNYVDNLNDVKTAKSTRNLLILNTFMLILSFIVTYYSNTNTPVIGDEFLNKSKYGKYMLLILFVIIIIFINILFKFNIL